MSSKNTWAFNENYYLSRNQNYDFKFSKPFFLNPNFQQKFKLFEFLFYSPTLDL